MNVYTYSFKFDNRTYFMIKYDDKLVKEEYWNSFLSRAQCKTAVAPVR